VDAWSTEDTTGWYGCYSPSAPSWKATCVLKGPYPFDQTAAISGVLFLTVPTMNQDENDDLQARLERLLQRRDRAVHTLSISTERLVRLRAERTLSATPKYLGLEARITALKSQLHFLRCGISKKSLAVTKRAQKLREFRKSLRSAKKREKRIMARLQNAEAEAKQIRDGVVARLLVKAGVTTADHIPSPPKSPV
jgi:hypothetical protein